MFTGINSSMLAGGHPGVVVSASYQVSASPTIPARLTGDIILIASFRRNSALPPSDPSGYTQLFTAYNTANSSITVYYQIVSSNAASSSLSIPNSTGNSVLQLRRCKGVGNYNAPTAVGGSNTTSHTLPALTLSKSKGLVVGIFQIQTPGGGEVTVNVPPNLQGYANNSFMIKRNSPKQFPATPFTTSSSLQLEATVEVY